MSPQEQCDKTCLFSYTLVSLLSYLEIIVFYILILESKISINPCFCKQWVVFKDGICVCLCGHTHHECRCPGKPEASDPSGARVTSGCLMEMVGIELGLSGRAGHALNG